MRTLRRRLAAHAGLIALLIAVAGLVAAIGNRTETPTQAQQPTATAATIAAAATGQAVNQYPNGEDQYFVGGIKLEGSGLGVNYPGGAYVLRGKQFENDQGIFVFDDDLSDWMHFFSKYSTAYYQCSKAVKYATGPDSNFEIQAGGYVVIADKDADGASRVVFDTNVAPGTARLKIAEDSTNAFACGANSEAKWGYTSDSNLTFTLTAGDVDVPSLGLLERSADPAEPAEGKAVIWLSDGNGKGADGDVLIASKANGVTRWATLFDHSAGAAW